MESVDAGPSLGQEQSAADALQQIVFSLDQIAILSDGADPSEQCWPFYQLSLNDRRLSTLLEVPSSSFCKSLVKT